MAIQGNLWEEDLFNYVNNSINRRNQLTRFLNTDNSSYLPYNSDQIRAVRYLENPARNVPQRRNSTSEHERINVLPAEQRHTFQNIPNYDISRKIVASTLIIGPPGTGKTYIICSGAILRAFHERNLRNIRNHNPRNFERIFITTFSNSASYRIYEKFNEIANLANTPHFYERIKLVQSLSAQDSYAFNTLQEVIGIDEYEFVLSNRKPDTDTITRDEWNNSLREVIIYVGTTDSLSILSNDRFSNVRVRGVIYDEASQITVPQFYQVIPDHNIKSICIVGDDKQLPPVTLLAHLGVSAISYLQGMNTYQNIPIPIGRRIELQRQYRMHPAIAQLTEKILPGNRAVIPAGETISPNYILSENEFTQNSSIFDNTLENSTVNDLLEILNPRHPLVILDTSNVSNALDNRLGESRFNQMEAEIAIRLYRAINTAFQGISINDMILTAPYRAQVNIFEQNSIRTGTVHQFQGKEAEVVIYSLTFAQPNTKSDFFSQFNLMYVGLSRAKKKLIILGNKDAMNHPDPAIRNVRNSIFNFQYISGRQGYPDYPINPVYHIRPSDSFIDDLISNLI